MTHPHLRAIFALKLFKEGIKLNSMDIRDNCPYYYGTNAHRLSIENKIELNYRLKVE
jgi:hypothetical protein